MELSEIIVEGDEKGARELTKKLLGKGIKAEDLVEELIHGMQIVGEKFERMEYFLPEIVCAADAMYAALDTLRPHLREKRYKGKIIIGTVYGDIHDIGKNIVKFFLEGSGFKVIDLGRDVPAEKFLESVEKEKADILACQL